MKYSDAYKQTLQAYRKQGKKYLKEIENSIIEQIDDFIKLLPRGGKILDVGCAGGRDCKKFIEQGFEVVGIDVVEEFLEEARKVVPDAKFINMDLLKLDFSEKYFDGIWSTAVLLHIQKNDMPEVLKNYCRILKPKGKLFIGLKLGKGSAYIKDKLSEEKRFFVYYQEDEIKKLLEDNGFRVISSVVAASKSRAEVKWIRLIAEKA